MSTLVTSIVLFLSQWVFALTTNRQAVMTSVKTAALQAIVTIENVEEMDSSSLVTRVTARIDSFSSPHPNLGLGDPIFLEIPGGEVNGRQLRYPGLGFPRLSRRYRIAARPLSNGNYRIEGGEAGLVPIQSSRTFTKNQVEDCPGSNPAFVHWDARFMPIPFSINADSFKNSAALMDGITPSFQTWRNVAGLGVEFLPVGCTTSPANENDGINNIVLITENWGFIPEAIAVTRNFFIGCQSPYAGQILDSDILLNAVHHRFSIGPKDGHHDVQNILTHEIGHLLGMGHETEGGDLSATMHKDADFNETKKRVLKASDIAGIREIYPMIGDKGEAMEGVPCELTDSRPFSCGSVKRASPQKGNVVIVLILLGALLGGRRLMR